ncbi:probable asparagine--tRNA ligase, mitochondrial [Lytechinus variegatus]|uniref:probable asparagine--tRNA ligase, mitochondrial n=1 Tax=Lytechinus variegatus TaxID=7654 RepID=UPI001BB2BA2B|nr:probable asparagine--tRNA ligase, mitochondrial [Lytechinus variegatus]
MASSCAHVVCKRHGIFFKRLNILQGIPISVRNFGDAHSANNIKDLIGYEGNVGKDVEAKAWIRGLRQHKGVTFLDVNDGSCAQDLQVVVKPQTVQNDSEFTFGSGVEVKGQIVKSQSKGQPIELLASSIQVTGSCDTEAYPFKAKVRHPLEYTRQYPHLRSRTPVNGALTRVRSAATLAVHNFFQDEGFINVHTPVLSSSDCEGGGNLFRVQPSDDAKEDSDDFFGTPVYLQVSGQLQLETVACSHTKAYTFGPTFRAENSRTRRHLAEFYMVEGELAFTKSLQDITKVMEDFVKSVANTVYTKSSEDVQFIGDRINEGTKHAEEVQTALQKPFTTLSYTEAISILDRHKDQFEFTPSWGIDLQSEHEAFLVCHCGNIPVFVVDYPKDIKPFYARMNSDNKTAAAVDLLVPRVGELIGGSLREERHNVLQQRIQHLGLQDADYQWYLDLRRFGTVPHGGFGLGFERLLQYLLGVDHIRDVIPFPRFPGSCPL